MERVKRIFKGCQITITKEPQCYKVILKWLSPRKESDFYSDYESIDVYQAMHYAKRYVSQNQLPHLLEND